MDQVRDIMIHGIPNVRDANEILREEIDRHLHRFGPIRWLRLGSNRGFHATNYGFLRYENANIHHEAVQYLNRIGIPHTRIWFELNPRPTETNHFLQEAPAGQRVQRQLEELERHEQNWREQERIQSQEIELLRSEVSNKDQRISALETQLSDSRLLVADLLNRPSTAPTPTHEPARTWIPLPFRDRPPQLNSQRFTTATTDHMPMNDLQKPPSERCHTFEQGSCPICLETFKSVNSVVTTHCGHLFCEACMFRWVKEQLNCPECRKKLGHTYYIRLHSRN